MSGLLLGLLALGTAGAAPVVESFPGGRIDWTNQQLVVTASSEKGAGAMSDLKAVEQAARGTLAPRLEAAARQVRVDGGAEAGVLIDSGGTVAEMLGENLLRWRVTETRYYTSGRVELTAELELQAWLSPAVIALAGGAEDATLDVQQTGVVIDARGTGLKPSFAPRVMDAAGQLVYSATALSREAASRVAPAVWVTDPADAEAVARAGAAPLFIRADDVRDSCDVVLDPRDAALLRVLADETDLLARGLVVVIVDP